MSVIERLKTMEELRDSLNHAPGCIQPPEWHEDILLQRKEKIENGEGDFVSLQALKSKHLQ